MLKHVKNTVATHPSNPVKQVKGENPDPLLTAKDNPWRLFNCDELASILGIGKDALHACRENGAQFVFGQSRPEWILEFLAKPENRKIQCKTRPLAESPVMLQRSA